MTATGSSSARSASSAIDRVDGRELGPRRDDVHAAQARTGSCRVSRAIGTTASRTPRSSCLSCHDRDYQATHDAEPRRRRLPHDLRDLSQAPATRRSRRRFDHAASFPLVGTHAQQPAPRCHVGNVYRARRATASGCHRDDYHRTTTPNHAAAGFPTTCENCHRPTDATLRGPTSITRPCFRSSGQHAQQACATCHANNVFGARHATASAAIATAYDRTTTPNHAAAGFPTDVRDLSPADRPQLAEWRRLQPRAVFPLVGPARAAGLCDVPRQQRLQGHAARLRRLPSRRVRADHGAEPRGRRLPDDVRELSPADRHELPRGTGFNHNAVFPLVGPARAAGVRDLSREQRLQGHATRLRRLPSRRVRPDHGAEPRGRRLLDHVRDVSPATPTRACGCAGFNHAAVFPLAGATRSRRARPVTSTTSSRARHATASAAIATSTTAPRRPTTRPPAFPTTCEAVTGTPITSWRSGTGFNHAAVFPLAGRHAQQVCATCHVNNVYKGTPRECVGLPSRRVRPHDDAQPAATGSDRRARAVTAPRTRPGDRGRSTTASRSRPALTDSRVPRVTRRRAPSVHVHRVPRTLTDADGRQAS